MRNNKAIAELTYEMRLQSHWLTAGTGADIGLGSGAFTLYGISRLALATEIERANATRYRHCTFYVDVNTGGWWSFGKL